VDERHGISLAVLISAIEHRGHHGCRELQGAEIGRVWPTVHSNTVSNNGILTMLSSSEGGKNSVLPDRSLSIGERFMNYCPSASACAAVSIARKAFLVTIIKDGPL
jgi:hypothetical protein